ncbi:MFS transporter [Kitasatospora sp. NPDC056800]|uniref:MFS transporter n=1 Tax=Kitasatospora sp. NPDC056800 TaxID=3345948 RepID=UPI0036BFDBD0
MNTHASPIPAPPTASAAGTTATPGAGAPGGRRRIGTWAVALAFWAVTAGTTVPTPLYPLYERAFGFSPLAVTVAFAVYALAVVAGLLALGGLSDRYGRRPVAAAALLTALAAAVVFLLAENLAALLVGRVLSGLAAALITGTATAHLAELAPADGRFRAGRLALAANMGGLACGPLLAAVLADTTDWPLRAAWVAAAALLTAALAALAVAPETVTPRERGTGSVARAPRVPTAPRREFRHAALAAGAGFAVLGVLTAVTGLFLAEVAHLHDLLATAATVSLAFACTGTGQLLAARLGRAALPAACAGLIVAAGLIAAAVAASSLLPLLGAALTVGLATGVAVGHGIALIGARTPPGTRSRTVSAFFAALYTMLALPAVGVGALIGAVGLRTATTVFAAAVAALAAAVLLTQREPARR